MPMCPTLKKTAQPLIVDIISALKFKFDLIIHFNVSNVYGRFAYMNGQCKKLSSTKFIIQANVTLQISSASY